MPRKSGISATLRFPVDRLELDAAGSAIVCLMNSTITSEPLRKGHAAAEPVEAKFRAEISPPAGDVAGSD